MAITKIQTGGIPALAVTHDKLHTDMDLSAKTVTLPSAITDTITNKLPLAGGAMTGNLLFGDSVQAQFGDSQDLRIYHDNTHSYIQDAGSGQLKFKTNGAAVQIIDGSNNLMINAQTGSSVDLYHSGSLKLATTSTGIDVTGTVTADGLTVDGAYSYLNGLRISGADTGNTIYQPTSNLSISSASGSISLKPSGTNILHATNTGVGIGATNPGGSKLYLQDTHTTTVTNATTMIANTTLTINGNSGQGSDVIRMGPMGTAGRQFIDVSNSAGTAAYDLLLNPIGLGNVGINTPSPSAPLHIRQNTSDAYTATNYNNVPTLTLQSNNAVTNYSGIRLTNSVGNYESFIGAVQVSSNSADMVFQGHDRATGTYKEYLRVYDNGRVAFSQMPNFASRPTYTNIELGAGAVVSFNNPHVDTGNDFSGSTNRFTAPIAGAYRFDFHSNIWKNAVGIMYFNWFKNGADTSGTQGGRIYGYYAGGWENMCGFVVINLAANDYVDLRAGGGGPKVDGNSYGQLTGYMLTSA
jgi:hypothetical protein